MDRLIATASVTFANRDVAPGSGTPQYATNGNPASSTPATVWPAYQYNAIQDELIAIIDAAGITHDKTNWAQIIQALKRLYSGNVTTAINTTTTLTLDNCGLVLCDATSGNVTLTLPAANTLANAEYQFVRIDTTANTVTINRGSTDTIDEALTSIKLPAQWSSHVIRGNGVSHWSTPTALPASSRLGGLSVVQCFAGNPNGNVAGNAGSATTGLPPDLVWDTTDNQLWVCTTTGSTSTAVWTLYAGNSNAPGRLVFSSATQLLFNPFLGDFIQINSVQYPIPSAGVAIANTGVEIAGTAGQNLVASTTYDVYLKVVAGVLTASFWLDAGGGTHMTSTTAGNFGVEVRNNSGAPDNTRTLIGKISTNGSSQFSDNTNNRLVISWFNRRPRLLIGNVVSNATSTATTMSELSTSERVNCLQWINDPVDLRVVGYASNNTAASTTNCAVGLDSTGPATSGIGSAAHSAGAGYGVTHNAESTTSTTEGLHFATVLVSVSANTGTFNVGLEGFIWG